jgi:hypothetical protein
MAAQAQRIADLERQVAELRAGLAAVNLGFEHVFAAGRESVTDRRRGVALREMLIDAVDARAYARGRASVLGAGSSQPAKTPRAERWLHAVPQPAAEAELGVGA